jgi:hypothetical protein
MPVYPAVHHHYPFNSYNEYSHDEDVYQSQQQSTTISTTTTTATSNNVGRRMPIPTMSIDEMALALRWTGEINRQLRSTASKYREHSVVSRIPWVSAPSSSPRHETLRGGGVSWGDSNSIYGVSPFSVPSSSPRIPLSTPRDDGTAASTIFHAKSPRIHARQLRFGAARWGPRLDTFLTHVLHILVPDEDAESMSFVFALAMSYLDRASSCETPRTNGAVAVPYVTPRTVHRLTVTALLLAYEALYGDAQEVTRSMSQSLGIPLSLLHDMTTWMKEALGNVGGIVTPSQLVAWQAQWQASFASQKNLPATPTVVTPAETITPSRAILHRAASL